MYRGFVTEYKRKYAIRVEKYEEETESWEVFYTTEHTYDTFEEAKLNVDHDVEELNKWGK